jgi:hypothetical protein
VTPIGYDRACRELEASRLLVQQGMRQIVRDNRAAHYQQLVRELAGEPERRESMSELESSYRVADAQYRRAFFAAMGRK